MAKKISKNVRLTDNVFPLSYKIHLEPDLDEFVFEGEEEIALEIRKTTSQITLHSAELTISSAVLTQNKKEIASKVLFSEKEETATFKFSQSIKPGKAFLKLNFAGILNDKMRGFYRSRYELDGKNYHMGVTQFESTDARRAFPCFDEPAKKAVFEVSLKIPSDRTLISNTIESEVLEHEGGFKTIKFAPSPLMSSYLLAFIVGHFKHIEKKTENGVLVRVFTTPDKLHQAKFALATAVKCIEFYEDYFAITYPLPTMDLVAVPDFAAGAMENWGAVTYRESAILVDNDLTSSANKQWVALVIAHELAHQWFGNLVTMEWWTHLWLNEGFASYMEYLAVDSLYPEWNIWSQFVLLDHAHALELDGLVNTHPIEIPVNHPSEIAEIFDAVSYSKGASVIRMLAEFLGKSDFKKGLQIYLKKHKYSNATTIDLWKALEASSGKKVEKIMVNWIVKPGYPLISLNLRNKKLQISQTRFFSNASSKKNFKDKTIWSIPMNILTPTSKSPSYFLFDKKNHNLNSSYRNSAFIKLNARETSFIRVNYGDYLEKLEVPLAAHNKSLRPSDRFGIVRDAFALAEAGISSSDRALKLALAYTHEESYNIWAQITGDISKIGNLLYDKKEYDQYKNYGIRVFSHISKHLGWKKKETESHSHSLLRPIVLYAMGKYKDSKTIEKAAELFKDEQSGKSKIPSDLRGVVFNLVAENGGEREYEILLNLFHHETLEEERDRLLRALCQFPDKKLLSETLSMAFGHDMHGQDAVKAVNFVLINRIGRDIAWEFIQKNWEEIEKRFGGGHLFTRFVESLDIFSTREKAAEIKKFFSTKNTTGLDRTISQVIEQIESNATWLARDYEKLASFLSQFS